MPADGHPSKYCTNRARHWLTLLTMF